MVGKAGDKFLCPADADSPACRGLEGVVARERKVDAVLVALPFFISEEVAECRVPQGDCFVGACNMS